ncbi:MAG: asparaginase [Planctomycetota bacterium]|nr:asparaginase [Planctomycetota bacterium]
MKKLVVMTASHNSEKPHIDAVRSILKKADLDEQLLQCGTHPPLPRSIQYEMIEQGRQFTPLYHNCSGKHAGILALARHLGAPLEGYKDPGHPAQQALMAPVAAMCELDRSNLEYGHDGCDIPAYLLTARQMATGAARFAAPETIASPTMQKAIRRLSDAIIAHPYLIAGKKRICSAIARHAKGKAIGKVGAEGAYMLALRHRKLGFAAKCTDGAFRGIFTFSANVCDKLGAFDESSREQMKSFLRPDVTNDYGRVVGHIEVPEGLLDTLNDIPEVG